VTRARHRLATSAALAALRMDRGVALLIAATTAVALAVLLPVASLAGDSGALETRLQISTVRGDRLGLPWQDARTPAGTQRQAVIVLFGLLVGMGVATLATAGVTVIALIGARDASRTSEDAVRRAVGSSRRTIREAALLEAGAIVVGAVVAGVTAGAPVSRVAASAWPGTLASYQPTTAAALVLGVSAFVVLGSLLPIVFARSGRMVDAEPAPRAIFGPAVAQFAAGLTVLVTASLLAHYSAGVTTPAAVANDDVLELTSATQNRTELGRRYATLLDRLSAASLRPSLTSPGAISGIGVVAAVTTDCGDCSEGGIPSKYQVFYATHHVVSPDSFQALGVRVLAGRGFLPDDRAGEAPVAVVNRVLAERHFQHGEAVGRTMIVGDDKQWYTVVGIVDEPPAFGFGAPFQPRFTVYLSVLQHPAAAADLLVSGNGVHGAAAGARHEAAAILGPLGGRVAETNMSRIRAREAAPVRWFSRWIALEGWTAVLLATVGMFAVMRIWVRSLLPELGLRRALGATKASMVLLVLRQAVAVVAMGLVAGCWFGWSVWNVLPTILRNAAVWDTRAVASAALPLIVATLAGALWPALRASREEPVELLAGR
jgi:putative ABC transport system permease protein